MGIVMRLNLGLFMLMGLASFLVAGAVVYIAAVKSKTEKPFWVLAILSSLMAIAMAIRDSSPGMWICMIVSFFAWCVGFIVAHLKK
jgi:hypothetical protein